MCTLWNGINSEQQRDKEERQFDEFRSRWEVTNGNQGQRSSIYIMGDNQMILLS